MIAFFEVKFIEIHVYVAEFAHALVVTVTGVASLFWH